MICLVLTFCIARIKNAWLWAGFSFSVLVLAILPALTERTGFFPLSAYWSPLNFLPYPFAALLFIRSREVMLARRILIFWTAIVACIVFALLEWNYAVGDIYFKNQGFALPPYTRPSLVFGIAAVAVLALHPAIPQNRLITFMAGNALSLYCLHIFFYPIIWDLLGKWTQSGFILTYGSLAFAIAWCYLLAGLLKNYLKQEVLV